MKLDPQKVAQDYLELASEQRIKILSILETQKANLSAIIKQLEATPSEVHRNVNRLLDAGLIIKDSERDYDLSLYGKVVCKYTDSLFFVPENKEFFDKHDFGTLPTKFIQRIGALQTSIRVKGFVKVLEYWKQIHENADKYIYNILAEVPYSQDIIGIVESKLDKGVNIKSIFSKNTIIPEERKKALEKKKFQEFIKNETLERRMIDKVSIMVFLNEKEAGVVFPTKSGDTDFGEMFYGNEKDFHEWCLDFFMENWYNSSSFQESKLSQ